ncbi:MAG: nitroreductase family protein [Treponema sp.]|jgi:nitroreductase|nr:nitroreductase family protein [Treponema sp.]
MNFADLAGARYSVRSFLDKSVEREKMDLILKAARGAPTAANRQPQRILVLDEPEQLVRVDHCTTCRFEAPLVFLVCYEKKSAWVRDYDQEHSGLVDASVVATHMMLQAADLGLGTTWVMWFDPAVTRTQFNLPEDVTPVAFLPTGYPAPDALPSDQHQDRLPLDKLVFCGSF